MKFFEQASVNALERQHKSSAIWRNFHTGQGVSRSLIAYDY